MVVHDQMIIGRDRFPSARESGWVLARTPLYGTPRITDASSKEKGQRCCPLFFAGNVVAVFVVK